MHVDKSFTKIQARVRPPPPIQAMPEFWEHLDLEPLPKDNHENMMMMMMMIMMKIMIIIMIEEWGASDLPVRDVWMRGIRVGAICRMGTYWKFRLEYCLNQNVTVCQNINIVQI